MGLTADVFSVVVLVPCFLVVFPFSSLGRGCVALSGHFAQPGSAHRLQLIRGEKSTHFNQRIFPGW